VPGVGWPGLVGPRPLNSVQGGQGPAGMGTGNTAILFTAVVILINPYCSAAPIGSPADGVAGILSASATVRPAGRDV
jgi:hypothetical protein